jgi:streptogramin lyase
MNVPSKHRPGYRRSRRAAGARARVAVSVVTALTIGAIPAIAQADVTNPFATVGAGPWGIALDAAGNVYTANNGGNSVSKVAPDGSDIWTASLVPIGIGRKPALIAVDTAGNAYTGNNTTPVPVAKISPDGLSVTPFVTGATATAWGVTTDLAGNVYWTADGGSAVGRVAASGTVTYPFAATGAKPQDIDMDGLGNLYTANTNADTVTKITPDGAATTLGSTGAVPDGIAVDSVGNVYTANRAGNSITKITPLGTSSDFALPGGSTPWGITVDSAGNLYTANNLGGSVTKVAPDGTVTALVSGLPSGPNNGPRDITIDGAGNLYVTVAQTGAIVKISPGGGTPDIAPAPPAVPSAPTASAGVESATVSITPNPVNAKYGAPTAYVVSAVGDATKTCTVTLPATSCTVSGLTAGQAYTFTAAAKLNTSVTVPSAASAAVTPTAVPTPSTEAAAVSKGTPSVTPNAIIVVVDTVRAGTVVVIGSSKARGRWVTRCVGRRTVAGATVGTRVACKLTPAAKRALCRGPVRMRLITRLASPGQPLSSSSRTVRIAGRYCGPPRVTG